MTREEKRFWALKETTEYTSAILQESWKADVFCEWNKIKIWLVSFFFLKLTQVASPLLGAQVQFHGKYKLDLKFKLRYFGVPSYWRSLYLLANRAA